MMGYFLLFSPVCSLLSHIIEGVFMLCSSIWGIILIAFGASLLLQALFGVSIPLFKITLAGLLIYGGIRVLMPSKKWRKTVCSWNNATFEEGHYKANFTSTTINLENYSKVQGQKKVYITSSFADLKVVLPHGTPVEVKASTTCAAIHMPNDTNQVEYTNLYGASEPALTVLVDATFSNIYVVEGSTHA